MANSLGAARNRDHGPSDFGGNSDALHAINQLRLGNVTNAAMRLDIMLAKNLDRKIASFVSDAHPVYSNRASFLRDMNQLATDLEKEGL
jgi:hypothetical protein